MKKILCVILVLLFAIHSFCLADSCISLSGSIAGSARDSEISVSCYEGSGGVRILSSLWPDHVVTVPKASEAGLFRPELLIRFTPEALSETWEILRSKGMERIGGLNGDTTKGSFTGDAFDHARTENRVVFSLSELIVFFQEIQAESATGTNSFLTLVTEGLCSLATNRKTESDLQFCLKIYDEGLYFTLEVFRQGSIVRTVSANLSSTSTTRFVFGRTENSRYYFRTLEIHEKEGRTELESSVYSTAEPSFRNLEGESPLYTERLIWSKAGEGEYPFELTVTTARTKEPVVTTGTMTFGKEVPITVSASVSVSGNEKLSFTLKAQETDGPVTQDLFDGKADVDSYQLAGDGAFLSMVAGKAAILAAEVYQTLPAEYQKLLQKLLFQ